MSACFMVNLKEITVDFNLLLVFCEYGESGWLRRYDCQVLRAYPWNANPCFLKTYAW